jgi:hypothetical protein
VGGMRAGAGDGDDAGARPDGAPHPNCTRADGGANVHIEPDYVGAAANSDRAAVGRGRRARPRRAGTHGRV